MESLSPIPLLSLPKELLFIIIDLIRPDGFEQFCLTCTTLHSFAHSAGLIRHHNQLKKDYTCLWSPDDRSWKTNHRHCPNNPSKRFIHPVALLNDISKTPIITQYIKHLSFEPLTSIYFDGEYDSPARLSCIAEKTELGQSGRLMKLLEASPYLKAAGQDIRDWHDTIVAREIFFGMVRGKDRLETPSAYAFVFLLSLLPNLDKLQVERHWSHTTESGPYSKLNNVMKLLYTITESAGRQRSSSLAKMSVFEVPEGHPSNRYSHFAYNLHSVAPFLLLPNLRKIDSVPLLATSDTRKESDFQWPYPSEQLRVPLESFNTYLGSVSPKHVGILLAPMQNLRHIHCRNWGSVAPFSDDVEDWWDVGKFVASIMNSPARHTLETLELHSNYCSRGLIGSLKGFSKLTSVSLQPCFLYDKSLQRWFGNSWEAREARTGALLLLASILPSTIEQVDIDFHCDSEGEETLPEAIIYRLSEKDFPRLQAINLHKRSIVDVDLHEDPGFPWWVRGNRFTEDVGSVVNVW